MNWEAVIQSLDKEGIRLHRMALNSLEHKDLRQAAATAYVTVRAISDALKAGLEPKE